MQCFNPRPRGGSDRILGTNNKIMAMKRQAFGYWDIKFFKLKIKTLHETKYALVG